MKVAIYSRGLDQEQEAPLLILLEELARHKIDVLIFRPLLTQYNLPTPLLENVTPFDGYADLDKSIECFITLGGDGTILDATCIDGKLWDLDSSEGESLTVGGDEPCPFCNTHSFIEQNEDEENTRKELLDWIKTMYEKYKNK